MHWAISDIHGCYEEYRALLEKISFSPRDTLYFLGDAVGRRPEPMKVVLNLAARKNVVPLLGNHDLLAWQVLDRFGETIAQNRLPKGSPEEVAQYYFWRKRGGQTTLDSYRRAAPDQRQTMLDYFARCKLWHQVRVEGALYWMVMPGWGISLQTVPRNPTPVANCSFNETTIPPPSPRSSSSCPATPPPPSSTPTLPDGSGREMGGLPLTAASLTAFL